MVGIVDLQDSVRDAGWRIGSGVPAGNRAVFGGKNENRLCSWLARYQQEISFTAIENDSGGSRLSARSKTWGRDHNEIVERTVNPVSV